jgi:hypothetical protein
MKANAPVTSRGVPNGWRIHELPQVYATVVWCGMSDRRKPTFSDAVLAEFGHRRIPGGCEDCDAYQIVSRVAEGIFSLNIHHDDSCPFLLAYNQRMGRT